MPRQFKFLLFFFLMQMTCVHAQTSSPVRYFPAGTFQDTNSFVGRDSFINNWYSEQLSAMKEPAIYSQDSAKEIYRFTWLRTFHNPVAIRIEKRSDQYILIWKVCSGAGGYDPGTLKIEQQINIDATTWRKFYKQLEQLDFWNLKTNVKSYGMDGSQWIIEGMKAGSYHVVDRWTPEEGSPMYECGLFLIKHTDLKIPSRDIY